MDANSEHHIGLSSIGPTMFFVMLIWSFDGMVSKNIHSPFHQPLTVKVDSCSVDHLSFENEQPLKISFVNGQGASAPLVVKVAETQKEKEIKKKVKEGTMMNTVTGSFVSFRDFDVMQ